jgi:hypothetical protein
VTDDRPTLASVDEAREPLADARRASGRPALRSMRPAMRASRRDVVHTEVVAVAA